MIFPFATLFKVLLLQASFGDDRSISPDSYERHISNADNLKRDFDPQKGTKIRSDHQKHDTTDRNLLQRDGSDSASLTQNLDPFPPFDYQLNHDITVSKCCQEGEAFFLSEEGCVPAKTNFTVLIFSTATGAQFTLADDQMQIIPGRLTYCDPSILNPDEYFILDNGELFSTELSQSFSHGQYCLEQIFPSLKHSNADPGVSAAYCPISHLPNLFDSTKIPVRKCCSLSESPSFETSLCHPKDTPKDNDWRVLVEGLGMIFTGSENFTKGYEVTPGYPECKVHERGQFLDSSWDFFIRQSDGHIWIDSLNLSSPFYCIDNFRSEDESSASYAYVCLSDANHNNYIRFKPGCQNDEHCIAKCCDPGQILAQNGSCFVDHDQALKSVSVHHWNGVIEQVNDVDFVYGSPFCDGRGIFITKQEERGEILSNGSLRFVSYDPQECNPHVIQIIPKGEYCLDTVSFHNPSDGEETFVQGALICYPDASSDSSNRQTTQVNYIYSIFLAISDIFILISFVIYLTVPDQTKRGLNKNIKLSHSILGRILLSFLFSLFFAYLCLIITKTASDPINIASNIACIALGVTMYISFLATFFWLNVLCFELWWKCARQESSSGRRWLWYQIYAWGNPLLLGTAVLFIEFYPKIGSCFVKPNFGIHSCFFSETRTFGSAAKWIYLNGPVAFLLTVDLIFFLLTVRSLLRTVQQSHKGTIRRLARQRLKLCFKLFLVMGICWLTEIISAATNTKWYITEVFNCLQGFVIFLIFILKPKILEAVKDRINFCCCGASKAPQTPRGRINFTASSILSEFLYSTKMRRPQLTTQSLSTSSFSTSSSSLSWGNTSQRYPSPNSSPASLKVCRRSPFQTIEEGKPVVESSAKNNTQITLDMTQK